MRTLKPLRDPAFDAGCWPSGPSDLRIGGGGPPWLERFGLTLTSETGDSGLRAKRNWEEHFLLVTRHNNNNKPVPRYQQPRRSRAPEMLCAGMYRVCVISERRSASLSLQGHECSIALVAWNSFMLFIPFPHAVYKNRPGHSSTQTTRKQVITPPTHPIAQQYPKPLGSLTAFLQLFNLL
jgi:hypothetical protein